MITTATLPPKGKKIRCPACGLTSSAPIVVAAKFSETVTVQSGRCSDRKACELRARRAKANAKETKP